MKKGVKSKILKKILELGYELGSYDDYLDEILSQKEVDKVLDNLDQEYTDIFLTIKKELYVIEIATIEKEKDIKIFKGLEYFRKYGNLEDALENQDITQLQYNKLKQNI